MRPGLTLTICAGLLGIGPVLAQENTKPTAPSAFNCDNIQRSPSKSFYENSETYKDPVDDSAAWNEAPPASQNMEQAELKKASWRLGLHPLMRSFLVIRNNKLVFERYYWGASRHNSYNVHSASKSIWGAAVGVAIDKHLIPSVDAEIAALLPKKYADLMDSQKKKITVKQLLTMSSGLKWTEDQTEYRIEKQPDWVGEIIKLPVEAAPGTQFNYSTGNSHLVSAILAQTAKQTGCQFIHANILAKIGVVAEHWGSDPDGYFSGGYNLYLTPRELAKFGLLYLNNGKWNGEQVVPSEWVSQSMSNWVTDSMTKHLPEDERSPYGYFFWLSNIAGHNVAIAWGHGGQMIYIIKDLNMVVVMTTKTILFLKRSDNYGDKIMEKYVIPAAK
ncbi:MAG: serine hydrolase [Hyphomicrobium sp.]